MEELDSHNSNVMDERNGAQNLRDDNPNVPKSAPIVES